MIANVDVSSFFVVGSIVTEILLSFWFFVVIEIEIVVDASLGPSPTSPSQQQSQE